MDWVKERDALIAQTVAFVQSVTGRKPGFATATIDVIAATIENSVPIENLDAVERPLALKAVELPDRPGALLTNRVFPQSDIRAEIQNRIAAFQAHQHRFQRDRDVYFRSVLAKALADSENSVEIRPLGSTTANDSAGDRGSTI